MAKEKKASRGRSILAVLKVILLAIVLYFLFNNKALIIILVFEFLDVLKNFLHQTFPYLPLDLVFVFGVTAAFYYSPLIAVIIFVSSVINRIVIMRIELRHITKCFRHFIFFFLIPYFRWAGFLPVAMACLVINYVMKYAFKISAGQPDFDKMHYHVTNFTASSVMFVLINTLYTYVPFLS